MSRLLRKLEQISRGEPVSGRRLIGMLAKHASAIARAADDGEFGRYVVKDHTTMERDYSAQRDRDNKQGIDDAWSTSGLDTFSDTPPTSGQNNSLQNASPGPKYAGTLDEIAKQFADRIRAAAFRDRLKQAVQSGASLEGQDDYPNQAMGHAELTDAQQARGISEAHDALEFYAPQSAEGGSAGEIFQRDGKEKSATSADFTPDTPFVEDSEARGLPARPRVLNDSRQAGQGEEPTARAWAEHEGFNSTSLTSVDSSGNPGPST
jgi:hypothetical protein